MMIFFWVNFIYPICHLIVSPIWFFNSWEIKNIAIYRYHIARPTVMIVL